MVPMWRANMVCLFIFIQKNNYVQVAGDFWTEVYEDYYSHWSSYEDYDYDYYPIYEEEDGKETEYGDDEDEESNSVSKSTIFEMVDLHEDIEANITFNRLPNDGCQINSTIHTKKGDLFFDENGELYPTESLPTLYLVERRVGCHTLIGLKGNVSVKFLAAFRGPGIVLADLSHRVQYHELNNRCIVIMKRSAGNEKEGGRKRRRRNKKKGQKKKEASGSATAGSTAILDPRIPPQFRLNPYVTIRLENFDLLSVSLTSTRTTCDASNWPDLDHGLTCGDCKALIDKMSSKFITCDNYCKSIGRSCSGAWEESGDSCKVKSTETCAHRFTYTSDAICKCGPILSDIREPATPEMTATVHVPNKACDEDPNNHVAHENDCSAFLHCLHEEFVVKYCSPGTLFNPQKKICDHPEEVYKIKPQCLTTTTTTTTTKKPQSRTP